MSLKILLRSGLMRIPKIYTEARLSENTELTLHEQEAQHIVKVLRMKEGESLRLFNGSGEFYPATIIQTNKKSVVIKTSQAEKALSESTLHTHLGQVMSRGDRMDYVIQKSTELGINEITPLTSERCELKLNADRAEKRIKHWQQVAISAAEQCGRACVPKIHPILSVNEWVQQNKAQGLSLVLHHRDTQNLGAIQTTPSHVNLLIGPEGGLSEAEIKLATEATFIPSTFGPRVMRTETAPIACLSILQWLWGDFQSPL
ncbi:MAG: 16S rRNA (uracil1498-N3)-methyltransferase [Oleiphilaceae bacterium]|jgi:16S rRNA (uracil1498-N3)-methyltransferase